jgi:hypothetical protein
LETLATPVTIRSSAPPEFPPFSSGCGGDEWKDLEFSQARFKLVAARATELRDLQAIFLADLN